jgi:hypothetical protein
MSGAFEALSGATAARAEGKSAQNIAEFNAQVAEQAGIAAEKKAKFASGRQAKKAAAIKSEQIAAIAKGGGLGSAVAGDLAAEQASELELENLLIGFEGEVEAQRAANQAELDRLGGRLSKQRGKAAARGANVQFGTQLAGLGLSSASFLSGLEGGT